MNKFRVLYYLFVFILSIILFSITDSLVIGGIIAIVISISLYLLISFRRGMKRINLIEEECDPYAFIEATEKQWEITGKNKNIDAYLSIDRAAGYILMGEYEDAIIELEHIDNSRVTRRRIIKLVYDINLASALYSINEVEKANEIYTSNIEHQTIKGKRYISAVRYLNVTRLISNKKYDEAKELISELRDEKLTNRRRAHLAYCEGLMLMEEGNKTKALSRFRDVVKYGNKLYIVKLSEEYISGLEACID